MCHFFLCRLVLCHVMPVVSASLLAPCACHIFSPSHGMSPLLVLCRVMPCHVLSSSLVSCFLCHFMSYQFLCCHSMSCHVMPRHVMSCFDTAVLSCLGTGPIMSFCSVILKVVYGKSCHPIFCRSLMSPFPVVLCLVISSRVM